VRKTTSCSHARDRPAEVRLTSAGVILAILAIVPQRGTKTFSFSLCSAEGVCGGWELGSEQHYFFDVAGFEGFEWPFLHGLVAVVGMTLGVLVWFAWMLATRSFGVMQRGA
jgi:hypothetical protein